MIACALPLQLEVVHKQANWVFSFNFPTQRWCPACCMVLLWTGYGEGYSVRSVTHLTSLLEANNLGRGVVINLCAKCCNLQCSCATKRQKKINRTEPANAKNRARKLKRKVYLAVTRRNLCKQTNFDSWKCGFPARVLTCSNQCGAACGAACGGMYAGNTPRHYREPHQKFSPASVLFNHFYFFGRRLPLHRAAACTHDGACSFLYPAEYARYHPRTAWFNSWWRVVLWGWLPG